jgi:DNA invertase Pin-like site-specific DNA recombinase
MELDVVKVYVEEAVSGSKPQDSRPEGSRMLRFVKRAKLKHIVSLKLDRLFRNAEDALRQTKEWDSDGITLHLVDMGGQSLCTASAIGRMMLTMMAAFAEFERNLISERTAVALAHKRSRGQVYNHIPFGYVRAGGEMMECPEEQQVICSIRQWRETGESLQGIADRLNLTGVATKQGGRWHPSTIQKILGNDLHKMAR